MRKSELSLEIEQVTWTTNHDHEYIIKGEIDNNILQVTIYSSKNKKALYRLFANEKEYITYKYNTESWSKAMLRNLESRDGNPINNYIEYIDFNINDSKKILNCQKEDLLKSIYEYQKQIKLRTYQKTRKSIDEMFNQLKPLPENLNEWVIDKVFKDSNYIIYQKKGKKISGYCTRCKRSIKLDNAKHNHKIICPNCQTEVTSLSQGIWKRRNDVSDDKYFNIINNTSKGLVVRVFHAIKFETYKHHKLSMWEVTRILVRENKLPVCYRKCEKRYFNGCCTESYGCFWHERKDCLYDTSSYLYTDNLDEEINESYKYCKIKKYANAGPIDVIRYLHWYKEKPIFEQLVEAQLFNLVTDIILYKYIRPKDDIGIKLEATSVRQALGLNRRQIKVIKSANVDIQLLRLYKYSIKINQELNATELRYLHIKSDGSYFYSYLDLYKEIKPLTKPKIINGKLQGYVTLKKLIRYKQKQDDHMKIKNFYTNYLDYLEDCKYLGYKMKSKSVLYPKDLIKAHEETTKLIKVIGDELTKYNLMKCHNDLAGMFEQELKGYCFIMPKTVDEFINESNILKHCVKSYAKKVARGETIVIFMREKNNKDKPFYTIEYDNNCIKQIQGKNHCEPPHDVYHIAEMWVEKVNKRLIAV